jgi:hypothetical protein
MREKFLIGGLLGVALVALVPPAVAQPDPGWAVPVEQGPAVFAMLPPEGAPLPRTAYRVSGVEIVRERVEIELAGLGGERQVVTLLHPAPGAAGAARTRFFVVQAAPAEAPLAHAVAAYVRTHEGAISPWRAFGGAPPAPLTRSVRDPVLAGAGLGVVLLALAVVLVLRRRGRPSGPGSPAHPRLA